MNVLIEMMTLAMARPKSGASNAEIAEWLEAKAQLHEHLADERGCDPVREHALAASAHRRAMHLITAPA